MGAFLLLSVGLLFCGGLVPIIVGPCHIVTVWWRPPPSVKHPFLHSGTVIHSGVQSTTVSPGANYIVCIAFKFTFKRILCHCTGEDLTVVL